MSEKDEFNIDIDDEYDMDFEDEEEDFEDEDNIEDYQESEVDSLDGIVVKIADFATKHNKSPIEIRQLLFEEKLRPLAEQRQYVFENFILSSSPEDEGYNSLLKELYPALAKYLSQVINEKNRLELITLLNQVIKELDEEQTAKSKAKQTEDPLVPEVQEVDDMEVKSIVNDIMNVYDKLYAPGFVNKPVGVLTSEGVYTLDEHGKPKLLGRGHGQNYTQRMYQGIVQFTDGYLSQTTSKKEIDSTFLTMNGTLKDVYSPMFHLKNIYGLMEDGSFASSWLEYRQVLYKDIQDKITVVLSKVEGDSIHIQMSLKELFTNCIIVDTFDRTKSMQIRLRLEGFKPQFGNYLLRYSKEIFATDTALLVSEEEDSVKVRNILFVFDENAYKSEILFAYKAQEKLIASGLKPSAQNVVLGRGLNGVDITENFADAGNVITGIIAGSRSGKGVVTLNILASLYADNCPVYYLDFKPDMAATLWETERELKAKGHNANIFAIDGLADQRNDSGTLVTPVRKFPYGMNTPEGLGVDTNDMAIMPYLKSMQFAAVLAQLRSNGDIPKDKKMFFVLDEAQTANGRLAIVLKKMTDLEAREKPKRGEEPSELYEYASKYIQVFQHDLKDGMNNVMNTTGGQGHVGLIILGQKADPSEWRLGELGDWRKGVFGNLVANMNIKLIGRDSGNSPSYGMPSKKFRGAEFRDERGYFIRYRGSKTPENMDNVELIKTYLVLNKNDFDYNAYASGNLDRTTFTGGLLTNIQDDTTRNNIVMNDFLNSDGSIRESIGFSGLMKLIMGDSNDAELANKMSLGYNILTEVFNQMGLNQTYSCVEEYLYDCSLESIFSLSELMEMFKGNLQVAGGGDVDWFQEEEAPTLEGADLENPSNQVETNPEFQDQSNFEVVQDDDGEEFDYMPNEGVADLPDDDYEPDFMQDQFETDSTQPDFEQDFNQRPEEDQDFPQDDIPNAQEHYTEPKPQPLENPVEQERYQSPNQDFSGFDNVYQEPIKLTHNPFKVYGRTEKPMSALNAINMMSKYLLDEITKLVGDLGRIHSFEVTMNGLVINNIAFRPQFSKDVIDSLPYDIKTQVIRGNVIELFNFHNIYKFRNLVSLRIDNARLAEGRVRREMQLSPKVSWYRLFKKFKSLQELYIGGELITDESSAQGYDDRGRGGFSLTEKLRERFKMPETSVTNSRMERLWNSAPVKIASGALGATLGVKAITVAATVFGGWGLLFGAFAGYGAYRELKKRR